MDFASTPFESPIYEGDEVYGASESDNNEANEQEDSCSSDATNKAEMHRGTDDPSAKLQAGLDTMTAVDEHSTEWKSEWGVEPSEFENAFAEMNGDGAGHSLEEILNSPEHPNQTKRFRD
jgi:hypothetical protein